MKALKAKEETWIYSEEELGRRSIKKTLDKGPENILFDILQHTHALTVERETR